MANKDSDLFDISSVPKFTDFNASRHNESLGDLWFENAHQLESPMVDENKENRSQENKLNAFIGTAVSYGSSRAQASSACHTAVPLLSCSRSPTVTNNRKSNDTTDSKPQSVQVGSQKTNAVAIVKPAPPPVVINNRKSNDITDSKSQSTRVSQQTLNVAPPPTRGRSRTRQSTLPMPFAFATDARMVKRCSSRARESEPSAPTIPNKVAAPNGTSNKITAPSGGVSNKVVVPNVISSKAAVPNGVSNKVAAPNSHHRAVDCFSFAHNLRQYDTQKAIHPGRKVPATVPQPFHFHESTKRETNKASIDVTAGVASNSTVVAPKQMVVARSLMMVGLVHGAGYISTVCASAEIANVGANATSGLKIRRGARSRSRTRAI